MYCVKCGVKLEEGINECPLCHTKMDFSTCVPSSCKYPDRYPKKQQNLTFASISTLLSLIAIILITTICFNIYQTLSWGTYVISSIALFYIIFIFPTWFSHYHFIIFISADFIAILLFLLIINLFTNGHWFLTFAFPLVMLIAIIIITTIALIQYVRKGGFFIAGGTIIFSSCCTMLIEFFQHLTFGSQMWVWSLYCVSSGVLLGGFLILAGIIKPLGNHLKKAFFI